MRRTILALLSCFACCALPTLAQSVQYTQNKADQKSRGSFSVDPSTLALGLDVELGSYAGRAGTGLPVILRYSSKVWRTEYAGHQDLNPHAQGWTTPVFAEHSTAGWTSSLDAPWLEEGTANMTFTSLGSSPDCPPDYPCVPQEYHYAIFRFYAHLPDGSTHELRRSDSAVMVDPPTNPPADAAGTYYAVNGSRMRLEYHTGVGAPPNVLYMPDGSRYIWDSSSGQILVKYVDRNGNTLVYNSSSRQWTDTLGRVISNPLSAAPTVGDQTYSLPGVNGSPVNYTFRWRALADSRSNTSTPLRYKAGWSTCDLSYGTAVSPNLFGGCHGDDPVATFNPVVLSEIVLPAGQSYRFTYNVYGEIDKVVYPTGGYERYVYSQLPMTGYVTGTAYGQTNRGVTDHYVSASGTGTDEVRWQYSASFADNATRALPYTVAITAPDGTRTERLLYAEQQHPPYRLDHVLTGRAYEERIIAPGGQMLRRKLTQWAGNNGTQAYPIRDPRVTKEVEMLLDTGGDALAATVSYQYDSDLNVTAASRYAYAATSPTTAQTGGIESIPQGALLRTEETDYLTADQNYRARNLTSLPTATRVRDAAGNVVAQSQMFYDETPLISYGTVTGWSDPATTVRGNLTRTSRWLDTTNTWVETRAEYDQCGNPVKTIDALGNQSQIQYSADYAYAYPTHTLSAVPDPSGVYGSTASLEAWTAYDSSTGLVTSTTDANGQTTTLSYADDSGTLDPLNRLKKVTRPDGGTTRYFYDRSLNVGVMSDYVRTLTALDSSRSVESFQFFDGLGRPSRTFLNEGGTPTVFLTTDTQYDAMGRVWRVSNPYRTNGSGDAINPSGRWTTTGYDSLGRAVSVTTPDGAVVTTSYSGNQLTVTDQTGKKRRTVTDAMGRLTHVDEPDSAGSLGTPDAPVQPTQYTYDVLGNLRKVDQGGQLRFFMYDSLSRLIRAKNPEQSANGGLALSDAVTDNSQWSAAYSYDANGNLYQRTDARGVTTTYQYDHLNRNITIRYSDGTKDVDRHYDGAINGRGRFYYFNWDAANNTRFDSHKSVTAYDAVGRPLVQHQYFLTNGAASQDYIVSRAYDYAGNVTSQTYPSGHTVTYNYDAAGRPGDNGNQLAFTGNLGDGVARTYSSAITYSEFGGIQQEQFGTQVPLYHKLHYNRRGQLFDIRLSTISTATDQWNWNRGAIVNYYSGNYAWEGNTPAGTDNNGNVRRQQHWVPADDAISDYTYTQDTYEYDSLNRLTSAVEVHGNTTSQSTQDFAQAYDYDRWGNRTINSSSTINPKPFELNPPPPRYQEVPEPSNRLYAVGDNGREPLAKLMRYDAAGNLSFDGYTGAGGRTYDAENRMTSAYDSTSNWDYYTYDADGRRVKRKIANEEWWQVYGMDGELLAEYRADAAPYLPSKEYGYRGGELLVTMSSGDDQRLQRFVSDLYYGALQRDPTSQELQDKTNQLASAGVQGQAQLLVKAKEIARALFTQTTYETSPNRTDTQYVADLYYTYLQRAPDDSGLNWWATQAAGGVTNRDTVCNAFEASSEFQTLVSTLYGTATSDNQRTEQFVNNFYLGAYGRPATSTELQQYRDDLNGAAAEGQSGVQSHAEAMGRTLFASQVSDLSLPAQQFVTNLYEGFLQRGPDAGGLSYWTSQAGTTMQSRQNVLNAFATCGPFRELSGALYRETFWLVSDHLGTPRMVADRTGSLAGIKRHDYLPFGEELYANTGGRTTTQGYSASDNVRQKFTKKERDVETNLDFFEARYYSSTMGRFTSPDEFAGGPGELYNFVDDASNNPTLYADLRKPQSLNKYQYAYNNPLRYIDPDGHDADDPNPQEPILLPPPTVAPPLVLPPGISKTPPNPLDLIDAIVQPLIDSTLGNAIRQTIGRDPELTPDDVPAPAMPQVGTPPSAQAQPMPPPPPMAAKVNKVRPVPGATGPHSVPKRDPHTGKVTGYTEYGPNGQPVKRFRGQGKPHGGVQPPLVLEPTKPGGRPKRARPAHPDETPKGL
jgi:RHS repeat-associated protein